MACSNCGKPLKEMSGKELICIHGIKNDGSGIRIGRKDFIIDPNFCSGKCAGEYFTNALAAINDKCEKCPDLYSISYGGLDCTDPRCPYVKELADQKRRQERCDRVVKRDGGWIKHVIKTCKKFYFG